MFFSREWKIFCNTEKLILGEGEYSISAENCRNKIYFFKHIFFLHNQETICLEKKHSPPLNGLCLSKYISERFQIWHHVLYCFSLYVYYMINLQFSLLIKFLFGNYVYLCMFRGALHAYGIDVNFAYIFVTAPWSLLPTFLLLSFPL